MRHKDARGLAAATEIRSFEIEEDGIASDNGPGIRPQGFSIGVRTRFPHSVQEPS